MDDERCAVEGCEEAGRAQVCVYDGRYHWHGKIHYENGHPFHPELRFRALEDGGWRGVCNDHYQAIKNGAQAELARRQAVAV